jgi:hypothetical protein
VSDLLDVFNSYDGSVVFRGLTDAVDGQPPVLGRIGWIFTGFGALYVLWGFVLRTQRSSGEGRIGEIARTWVVIAFMVGGPLLMRASMEGADGLYSSSVGGPAGLAAACVKAAYAMPELNQLFDALRRSATEPAPAQAAGGAQRAQLIDSANDGSVLGYLEAFGVAVWDSAAGYAADAGQTWNGMVRVAALASGLGAAMIKCLLIALTIAPLCLLLLASGALIWFMGQLRYFLAVSGTMMLPLFVGMYSLPEGHPGRHAAQAYVMHMVSLALWPVAWAIGHTGTIALYNALIALVAGTSRVPDLVGALQWSAVTGPGPTAAQVQAAEAALGNWFMGNLAALLSVLVGGIGFFVWVLVVSALGPVFLHRLLTTGTPFMAQAAEEAGRRSAGAARLAAGAAQWAGLGQGPGPSVGPPPGERLLSTRPETVSVFSSSWPVGPTGEGPATMGGAARGIDDSGGKEGGPV